MEDMPINYAKIEMTSTGEVIIHIPENVRGDKEGYQFLAQVAGETLGIYKQTIKVNFKDCLWFDGNLCAALGNILDGLKDRQNAVFLSNLNKKFKAIFARNGFLKIFSSGRLRGHLNSLTIPYRKFQLTDEQEIKEFMSTELFEKGGMPRMSFEAKKSILISIFEVCVNAIFHGKCENVYCCGQIFPNRTPASVLISFVDLGRTIRTNVNEYKDKNWQGCETIMWALVEGNTTKTGSQPGGLGLGLLQSLINLNKGKLQIVSANGFIEMHNEEFSHFPLDIDFPGTIVTLELLLQDTNYYRLTTESTTRDNIF